MNDLVAASGDLPTIISEIDAIETVMRTDRGRYNRDEGMQSRARSLYQRRADMTGGRTIVEREPSIASALSPMSRPEFFAAAPGGDFGQYLAITRNASDVLFAVPASERAAFVDKFDRLPDTVSTVMLEELMSKVSASGGWCGRAEMDAFRQEPGGHVLDEWGGDAPYVMARVRARIWRVIDQLTEADAVTFSGWLLDLTSPQAAALYRKLGQ